MNRETQHNSLRTFPQRPAPRGHHNQPPNIAMDQRGVFFPQRSTRTRQRPKKTPQDRTPTISSSLSVVVLVVVLVVMLADVNVAQASVSTACGGVLEEPRGVVQSPGFPGPFPLPVSCRWVLHAPPGKKIVLYFTQYFLRGAFHMTEYDYYSSEVSYAGRKSLGQINFEDHIHTVVAYNAYLVLDFRLHQMTNIHLRVEEHLQDVYGFNITYEVVGREERVRQDTCSVSACSFLGHCMAARDFSRYWCDCFPGFFGAQCQYGPFCDPDKGINMCRNQGRCRYFYGSMVNVCECPPGYVGPKCEHREDFLSMVNNQSTSSSAGGRSPECLELGCSDQCERNLDGQLHCVCREGFQLAPDRVTCFEQRLYRATVSVPLVKRPADWDAQIAATQAMGILHRTGMSSAQRFKYDGINSTGDQDLLRFHFYVNDSEVDLVRVGVGNLMGGDHFNLSVESAKVTLRLDPGMKILSLENYDVNPALEGKSLTLVCTARGSGRLKFRWYKDQFLFNASLTSRSAWEVRIEDEFDVKQMSIFNVDGVTMFDKGTFSCEVEDFGEVVEKFLKIDVMPLPHVELKPVVANVLAGQAISFRCLSPDENMRTFSYQWLRDGQVMGKEDRVNGELVEDMWPSGSRLFIPRLLTTANYSCRVRNKAGTAHKTARVFCVDPSESHRTCESSQFQGVRWNRTYGGHFDLQPCPVDSADFKVVGLEEGYARRDCVCDGEECRWTPPNYAKCHSVHLIFLREQLERWGLGYQVDDLGGVWGSLYQILYKARNRTLAGDVEMFAVNLHTIFHITRTFPAAIVLASRPPGSVAASSFSLKSVASFMNMLLDEVRNTNDFEKKDLSVGARILHVCEILAELAGQDPGLIPLFNLTFPRIEFVVRNVTVIPHNASAGSDVGRRKLTEGEEEISKSHLPSARHLMSVPDAYRLLEEENLNVLQVTFTHGIFQILRVHTHRPEYRQFLTPLVSLLPIGGSDDPVDDPYKVKAGRVVLEFPHSVQVLPFAETTTTCVSWDRKNSEDLVGEWNGELCDVIHRGSNVTRCLCPVPGYYAVVVSATNTSSPVLQAHQDTVLLVGCLLCMCGLVATLLILFIHWRHTSGSSSIIHVNFIISLAGINLLCILCLSHTHRQTLCVAGRLCLHLLQLAAFSFLLMEATHTYVCVQTAAMVRMASLKASYVKYCLVGWGVPSLATLAVALLSEVFGYDKMCTTWCWWSVGQWQHLSFLVPLVVMVVVQVVIMAACLFTTRKWSDERRFRDRKKYRLIAWRSLVLQGLVVLLSLSGHLAETTPSLGRQWFFVLVDITLTVVVVTTLLFFKPHVCRLVFSILLPAHKRALASDSFRAFVLPDRVEDTEEAEVKRIQQYCSDHDRSKFTTQHKETLRNLLGSSSSGSETSGVGTGTGTGTDSTISPGSSGSASSSSAAAVGAEHLLPLSLVPLNLSGRGGHLPHSSSGSSSWSGVSKDRVAFSDLGAESRRTPSRTKTRGKRCGGGGGGGGGETCGRGGAQARERCGGGDMCGRGSNTRGKGGRETHGGRHACRRYGKTDGEKARGRCANNGTRAGWGRELPSHGRSSTAAPPHPQSARTLLDVEQLLGLEGPCWGRDLLFADSGYEGTESGDSRSFPPGASSLDWDSPVSSSESDLTHRGGGGEEEKEGEGGGDSVGGGDDNQAPSPSSPIPDPQGPVPRIALLAATPACSPQHARNCWNDEDGRDRETEPATADVDYDDIVDREDLVAHSVMVDCDVIVTHDDIDDYDGFFDQNLALLSEDVLHTAVELGEPAESSEHEAFLTVDDSATESPQLEHETLL